MMRDIIDPFLIGIRNNARDMEIIERPPNPPLGFVGIGVAPHVRQNPVAILPAALPSTLERLPI